MKIRRSIFWFTVIVAVLIALVLWHGKKPPVETPPTASVETNVAPPAATMLGQPAGVPAHTAAPSAPAAANMVAPATPDKGEQIKEGLAKLNDMPIAFYGRLEDQFGSPVVGAKIAASIRIYNGVQSTVERSSVICDANGFFQVKGGNGESLGLWPSKEGYTLATTGTEFKYSYMYADHYAPDPNNPTIIKMWKLQGTEPLVDISKEYKLPFTDAPIFFDLVAGKIVPTGGDIKIKVNRPSGEVSEHNPQKWSIDFEIVDGGFIETSGKESAITFAAPDGDYQPSGIFANNNGTDGLDKSFFVESRNGHVFSKLYLSLGINNKPDGLMYITFRGVANANSSRNWEATAPQ
jgi:hypothetical protein